MNLISSKFNFNSTLSSIVKSEPDGSLRDCLIDYNTPNKAQQLVNHAYDIEKSIKNKVFLYVKYPFGSRPKRIEIVLRIGKFIVLCKFTNSKRVDEAALELQSIISNVKTSTQEYIFKGLVIYHQNGQKVISDLFATVKLPDIKFEDIKILKTGNLNGIFNKSESSC